MLKKLNISKLNIVTPIKVITMILLVFSAISFVEKQQNEKKCVDVKIHIAEEYDNFFIEKADIYAIVSKSDSLELKGMPAKDLFLKKMEMEVEKNEFVRDVEVFKDLKGNLIIDVKQNKPIARVIHPYENDIYIDTQGNLMPTSEKFTARVLLISGKGKGYFYSDEFKNQEDELFKLIEFIHQDDFWRAQIAQLNVKPNGDIVLHPQVTKQKIEFGKAINIEKKFKKLKLFYERILPQKGWNTYTRVNLEFENQIVCE